MSNNKYKYRRLGYLISGCISLAAVIVACGGGGSDTVTVPTPVPPNPNGGDSIVGPAWNSYGSNAQHDGLAKVATQEYKRIAWLAPMDTAPTYTARGYLLVHYGSPVITQKNTVVLPIKDAGLAFHFEARSGATGALIWSESSDYIMPEHNWVPTYNVTLTGNSRVYAAGAGGKVLYRDNADAPGIAVKSSVFYGDSSYAASKAAYDASILLIHQSLPMPKTMCILASLQKRAIRKISPVAL